MKLYTAVCTLLLVALCAVGCMPEATTSITQAELVRRTQELFDSVAGGDQTPWKKYFAADALYFDEKGRSMDKTALVADVSPLPTGYSGSIKIVNPQSRHPRQYSPSSVTTWTKPKRSSARK